MASLCSCEPVAIDSYFKTFIVYSMGIFDCVKAYRLPQQFDHDGISQCCWIWLLLSCCSGLKVDFHLHTYDFGAPTPSKHRPDIQIQWRIRPPNRENSIGYFWLAFRLFFLWRPSNPDRSKFSKSMLDSGCHLQPESVTNQTGCMLVVSLLWNELIIQLCFQTWNITFCHEHKSKWKVTKYENGNMMS